MTAVPQSMLRMIKSEGFGRIDLVEDLVPSPGSREILVKVHRSLISRGSEIGGRFRKESATDPAGFGYSDAGEVARIGSDVTEYAIGDRVVVVAPHAEYVIGDVDAIAGRAVTKLPPAMNFDQAVFHPLTVGAVLWNKVAAIQPHETVVVSGAGLVGNLVMQEAQRKGPALLIAIDLAPKRCALARRLGADHVINAQELDPVREVLRLTGNLGAHLVFDCVGGPAGVRSFEQSLAMTRRLGRIHVIALYHEEPLRLDSSALQQRMIIGGYFIDLETTWRDGADEAMERLERRDIDVEQFITHRFAPAACREAYQLLHDHPADALGVVFDWIA